MPERAEGGDCFVGLSVCVYLSVFLSLPFLIFLSSPNAARWGGAWMAATPAAADDADDDDAAADVEVAFAAFAASWMRREMDLGSMTIGWETP